jgi:DNA-binding NtrC family response regulator
MEDIPYLVDFFIQKLAVKYNRPGLKVSKLALHQLVRHTWKGNIRELRNVLEKAVLLSEAAVLGPADFEFNTAYRDQDQVRGYNLEQNEKQLIGKALKAFGNNKKLTAQELGINRTTLYNKMKKHGFE